MQSDNFERTRSLPLTKMNALHKETELSNTASAQPGMTAQTSVKVKPSFLQQVKSFAGVETFLFLSIFSFSVKQLVDAKLTFVKACVTETGLQQNECLLLKTNSTESEKATEIATNFIVINIVVSTIPSMIMGILIGSFCDKYQRKIPLLIAAFGIAQETVLSILCTVFMDSSLWFFTASKIPAGFLGGLTIIISGAYAHVSAVATPKLRQVRFAVLQMLILAGVTIGTVAGGYLFQEQYFILVYGASILSNVVSVITLAVFMEEEKKPQMENMTFDKFIKAFFDLGSLKESYQTVVAPRDGNKRLQIWLLILASCVVDMPLTGLRSLVIFYVETRYGWTMTTLANVTGSLRLATSFVTIIAVRIFTKHLKLRDPIIALIGLASLTADYATRGLATTGTMFAMAYVLGAVNGCTNSAMDHLLTSLLNNDEIGKILVFKSLFEMASPPIGTAIFGAVNQNFSTVIPGAMLLTAAALILIPVAIMFWILLRGTVPTPKERSQSRVSADPEDINTEGAVDDDASVVVEIRRNSVCL